MKDYENEDMMQREERDGNEQNTAVSTEAEHTAPAESENIAEKILDAEDVIREAAETVKQEEAASAYTPNPADSQPRYQPVQAQTPGGYTGTPYTPVSAAPQNPQNAYPANRNAAYTPYNPTPVNAPSANGQNGYAQASDSRTVYGSVPGTAQPSGHSQSWSPYPDGAYGQNPVGANGCGSQYQGRTYNAYAARSNTPASSGDIAYAPGKKKEKKPLGTRAVACICAACVLLSGLAGFGGATLANRVNGGSGSTVTETQRPASVVSSSGDPVVIYKSVDDVATSTATTAGGDLTYAQVAALVKDSVVEINTEYTTRNSWFQYNTQGAGSGVIISEDGYIITNAHVILDENMQNVADTVTVRLTDGSEFTAEVQRYDSDEDIAIIKIDAAGLTPARVGDSGKLVVGEELVIVGNPLGELGGSVSNGIVSATEREIQVGGVTMHLIQTNAAVNPGNSGGGMFNMKGQLVGIVNAKSSGSGIEGLGFAIPINQALTVTEQLLTYGYVRGKPMIGVSFEDVSGSNYFFYYSVKAGVYVRSLTKGMNDNVLKEGDRIIAVNGEEISSSDDIKAIIYASSIGDKLTFQLYRDNKLMEVEVTCYERTPENTGSSISFGTEEVPGSLDDFFGGR